MHKERIFSVILYLLASSPLLAAADYWLAHDAPGVVSNNDCGIVSRVEGGAAVRRAYMTGDQEGVRAYPADRLNTGDEIATGPDATLEWRCGNNLLLVLGPNSRARLLGLRLLGDPGGLPARRLDVLLLEGEIRIQARLNSRRPEAALVTLPAAEVLVRRGDVAAGLGDGWTVTALAGQIEARIRREGGAGAPFAMAEGSVLARGGEEKLEPELLSSLKRRLAFTFERISAALPPVPAVAGLLEAP